jgi:hypothetical protein
MTIKEKLTKIAEDMPKVYEAGKTEGIAEGKQAEYDAFWDALQENGKRTAYNRGFSGASWNDKTFFPKYDIKPMWAIVGTFIECGVTDLEARLKECGVVLDTSNNYNYGQVFSSGKFTIIPEIVFSGFAGVTYETFANTSALHTIRKITLLEGFNQAMVDTFTKCTALENVVFEGVIPKSINMQWSEKLTKASITSVINALSTTATGQTATFSKTAVNNAFATTAGAGNGSTSAEWLALVATRSNWTIALA